MVETTPLGTRADNGTHSRAGGAETRDLRRDPDIPVTPPREARVGPYRLAERLGEGGMGVVHLGLDERGRAVAVKVLREHVAQDPSARARLAREFDTLRRVRHERVAPVLDVDIDGPHPYLVTRYVPGPPLDAWVRDRGPLHRDDLLRLGRGLAEALGAIHEAGVVHRDLKPGNVLMVDGDPVVIDFGIAHVADDVRLTSTGLVMGTPGYLPPELLDGADVGEATDWWGWAATLAYAGTGRDPFGKGPLDAIFHRVYRGDADLRGVDPALARLLTRAFDPDPARRPGLAGVLESLEDIRLGRGDAAPFAATAPVEVPRAPADADRLDPTIAMSRQSKQSGQPGPARAPDSSGLPNAPGHSWGDGAAEPATRPQPVLATRSMPQQTPWPAPAPLTAQGSWAYAGFRESPRGDLAPAPVPGAPSIDPASREAGFGGGASAMGVAPRRRPRNVGPALVALLAALVALAASLPVLAVLIAVGWSLVARSVHASVLSVVLRREMRGRRPADVPRAMLVWPLRLVPATLTTVLVVLLTGVAAMLAAFATAAIQETTYGAVNGPLGDLPLAVAMLVGVLLGWWGPAGTALRHGSRVVLRAAAPGRWGVLAVSIVLWLAAAYFALRSQANGVGVQTWPLPTELLSMWQFGF